MDWQTPIKRKLVFSPKKTNPSPNRKKKDCKITPEKANVNFRTEVAAAVMRSKYKAAIRKLVYSSKAGKDAFLTIIMELIKQEISKLRGEENIFSQKFTLKALEEFQWGKVFSYISEKTPVAAAALTGMFPSNKRIMATMQRGGKYKRPVRPEESLELLHSRVGLTMAIAMYTASPKRNKFIQTCVGIEMWRQGSSHKLYSTLNKFGISQQYNAARGHIDEISDHHSDQIMSWKSEIEKERSNKPCEDEASVEGMAEARQDTAECPEKKEDRCRGFSLGWDNVQIQAHARHEGKGDGRENKFHLWGVCFGTENRVVTSHMEGTETHRAADLSPWCILPTPTDFTGLRERMVFVVRRIIAEHIPGLNVKVKQHVVHEKTATMQRPSKVVNLGVVEANPSSTEGCTKIMRHIQQYVPVIGEHFDTVVCHGDNGSVERMRGSKHAAVNARTAAGRLQGLEEAPQEFHKEALLLQDFMNLLYSGASLPARGSVAQLKVDFGHRGLKKKVMDNFKHAWDMMEFMTAGYVVLLALSLANMSSAEETPQSYPSSGNHQQKVRWIEKLAADIVDRCWMAPSAEDLRMAADAYTKSDGDGVNAADNETVFPFCKCKQDSEEDMVLCCSAECPNQWFHLPCVGLENAPDKDWFCSTACRQSKSYIYCVCRRKKAGEDMVQCHLGSGCRRKEWYHLRCLCLHQADIPATWYCCDDCALGAEDDDQVKNYSQRVVWEGLNLLVRRDAVREGDGPAIITHWKLDLVQFWKGNHWKYLMSACQLLANVGGFLPERLRSDLIWNRLVNVKGKVAGNIGMDLLNEFLNNDFKDMLKRSKGRYTELQVKRVSRMSGAFGRQLDQMFTESGLGVLSPNNYHEKAKWLHDDVARFVEEFAGDGLFEYCPPRKHEGFEEFVNSNKVRSPGKMGRRLKEITASMDFWRDLARL